MDYVLDSIAIVRVTGNSGQEVFIAALNRSQRQDIEIKPSE